MRTASELFVSYFDGTREYYDLGVDPYETRNVVAYLSPRRRSVLERQLASLSQCDDGPSCRTADQAGVPGPRGGI
jgi:hypothetical protein